MEAFRRCVNHCGLDDIKSNGCYYTWNNKQQGSDRVFSKLDRVLGNDKWRDQFSTAEAIFMEEGLFDHTPTLIRVHEGSRNIRAPFKYFHMWSMGEEFISKVQNAWNFEVRGCAMFKFTKKLKQVKIVLKEMNKQGFSQIHIEDTKAQIALQEAQKVLHLNPNSIQAREREQLAAQEYQKVHAKYSSFMQQKSKLSWLKDGDENSKAFHNALKTRRLQNTIYGVADIEGRWVEEQCQALLVPFSPEEVKQAIFSIPGDKSPGPDGLGQLSIKMLGVLLVLSVKCPGNVTEFRPIACCNVIYKCITKLMCSRLSKILPEIIAANQGAFIKGRFIAHNILICQDIVKNYGKKDVAPGCIIKMDLKKAYDSIDWCFIEELLQAMKFPSSFVEMIMECIKSPSFCLMINGELVGFFKGKRGLRQGDPLSPLIFLICMEYFSRTMKIVGAKDDFQFHPRCTGIKLNHLCFADDIIMCCKGEFKSVLRMLQGFTHFSESSGLEANKQKSELFTVGLKQQEVQRLLNMSGFSLGSFPFSQSSGNVNWDSVCCSKKEGGLGIKNVLIWNQATLGRYVWAIALKKDNLWVRWVHEQYVKEENWWEYNHPQQCSWYWKMICQVKDQFKVNFSLPQILNMGVYSVTEVYKRQMNVQQSVSRYGAIWGRLNIPKHRFLCWLVMLNRLKTADRLTKVGVIDDATCLICGLTEETHCHLFFQCYFSKAVIRKNFQWLQMQSHDTSV
ncbi:uncharacterized protein LOC130591438 [Beta vulgaris subsp. vulgaris]|uniref:uncharacterized protein LOC130591438 n=1 Tax=Beta vulgaris subsp. vulgaris TaxID=3555 RepID=UPI002548AEF9|nr:uncharacterized protein LOC130591438 [Beta vulgaris subsp. vulgaris]